MMNLRRSEHFTEDSNSLTSEKHWKVMTLAFQEMFHKFVDITYPKVSTKEEDDHICTYAKEVISLGRI